MPPWTPDKASWEVKLDGDEDLDGHGPPPRPGSCEALTRCRAGTGCEPAGGDDLEDVEVGPVAEVGVAGDEEDVLRVDALEDREVFNSPAVLEIDEGKVGVGEVEDVEVVVEEHEGRKEVIDELDEGVDEDRDVEDVTGSITSSDSIRRINTSKSSSSRLSLSWIFSAILSSSTRTASSSPGSSTTLNSTT